MRKLDGYKLKLEAFLLENNPELAKDQNFLDQRAESAYDLRKQLFENGTPILFIEEQVNKLLFEGLGFSQYSIIKSIIDEDFSEISHEHEEVEKIVQSTLDRAKDIFEKYPSNDDFNPDAPEWVNMETEIRTLISLIIEENGLQQK